jgi:hypothetical protein
MLDPDQLLSGSVTGANSTALSPIPEGEFNAVIQDVTLRDFVYKKGDKTGQTGYALDINWEINDEKLRLELKRTPNVRQSMILDLNGDAIAMGEGLNVGLGRLRKAVGQNEAGKPWSPLMLKGSVAMIATKQRMDGETIYTDVARVAAA